MILIDLAGLTEAPVNPRTLVRAYNLSGYLLPPERRLPVLKRLLLDATPHLVYTGPEGAEFWRDAPAHIQVRIIPGNAEVGRRRGTTTLELDDIIPDDLQGFEQAGEGVSESAPYHYKIVNTAETLAEFAKLLGEFEGVVGLDTEATSEDDRTAELVGVGISFDHEHNYYLPRRGPLDDVLMRLLWDNFVAKTTKFVAHNAKYDIKVLARALDMWYNQRKEAIQ